MTRRAGIAVATGVLLSIGVIFGQDARKATLEGTVVSAGHGTPLAGARVIVTRAPGGRGGLLGLGGDEAALLAQFEAGGFGLDGGIPPALLSQMMGRGGVAPAPIPSATTDESGRYSIPNLDAGTYQIAVQANGHVPRQYGQNYANGPANPVPLQPGQSKTADFALTPAGNIGGRIRDANNQPAPGISIQLLKPSYNANGQRQVQTVATGRTDDRGEYRIYWVAPGRYYLRAGSRNGMADAYLGLAPFGGGGGNPNEPETAPTTSYFPGAPDLSGARAVELTPGGELAAIDWAIPTQQEGRRVSIRIVDTRTGRAPARAEVTMMPYTPGISTADMMMDFDPFGSSGAISNYKPATGTAEFEDVAPGTYRVSATVQAAYNGIEGVEGPRGGVTGGVIVDGGFGGGGFGGGFPQEPRFATGSTLLTVADADVDNATITVSPPGTLTGHIRVEGELKLPPQRGGGPRGPGGGAGMGGARGFFRVQLVAESQSPQSGGGGMGQADTNGDFRLTAPTAGDYRIRVMPLPGNAYVQSAQMDGTDVLNAPLTIATGAPGTLRIVVNANGGEIRGTLVDAASAPLPSGQVVLVPNRTRDRADLYKTVNSDANGKFTIPGVPPGEYKLFSWQALEPYSWFDPEVLERWEPRGTPVRVSESSTEDVQVRIIPGGIQ